jgi:predicted CXXCH cytochrome family protein
MTKSCKKLSMWVSLSALLLFQFVSGVVLAQRQPAAAQPGFVSWEAPANGDISGYKGNDADTSTGCIHCHQVMGGQVAKTVHRGVTVAGTSGASCEACHGPGKAHADAELLAEKNDTKDPEAKKLIFRFDASPKTNSDRCLVCHSTSKEHDLFNRSEHKLQAVSCQECHASHLVSGEGVAGETAQPSLPQAHFVSAPKLVEETRWLNESLLKETQPELCVTCHRSIQAQFALPNHHRVPEGLMKCSDCHSPHGSITKPLLKKTSAYETCVTCHVEKRGPFAHEHASVKVEGCTICHTPHGSVNQYLLQRAETRFLCLSCHISPENINVPHGHLSFQTSGDCTRCHAAIHGSNFNEFFLQ